MKGTTQSLRRSDDNSDVQNETPVPTEGRRGGRAARTRRRAESLPKRASAPRRRLPPYEPYDESTIDEFEHHSDWILREIGVEFRGDEEALELFSGAGAKVSGNRVTLGLDLVKEICATAPTEFDMYGRTGEANIRIGGDRVVFAPAYGPPFVTDIEGGRRYATFEDFTNFVKLTYSTPWLHHDGGTMCEPVDLPVNKRHLDMVYAHLRYSDKPFMGSVTKPERARDSIEMARIVFGEGFVDDNCVIQGNINVNSPLVFDSIMTGAMKTYARANQGCVISPFIIGGAMGPVTQPALIAQSHAEALMGVALTQLVRPGSPMVYGNFLTTMDLRSGAPTFGTPEAVLSMYAIGQLARRAGLPLRPGGHLTAATTADAQAMQASADTLSAGILGGVNFVLQSAGWLEGGLTMGYEKFVMDLDRLGMTHRLLDGLTVDENSLGREAFLEAGPGIGFLGTHHTLQNFESANYISALADTLSYEQWSEGGSFDTQMRANLQWKEMLAAYEPPPLDPAVDRALADFVEGRKGEMPDEWH